MADSKPLPFPYTSLTKIHGIPTAISLRILKMEVYANASAIPSLLGGGTHGHLGAVMDPAAYAALQGTQPIVAPVHPGPHPGHPNGATSPQITETNRLHKEALDDFAVYTAVVNSLKSMIIDAV
ncbi:MAG: hypothetical protein HKN37_06625, partial [Rhodothermales bacterium]|nr:hypothetical protein [Rhodothermales bacterium]